MQQALFVDVASSVSPETRPRGWGGRAVSFSPRLLLVGILGLALALRLTLLGQNSLWFDEAFVAYVAHKSWTSIPPFLRLVDAHPPLYYLLAKAWIQLVGTSEAALRMPSVCFSAASVPLTYVLARRVVSEQPALLAAFLTAVAPLQIMSGQEARMYPLLGMLTLASTLALSASVERGGVLRWAVYVGTALLLAYTHYLAFLVIAAHGLWVVGYERRHFGAWLLAVVIVTVAYLPWAPSLWFQITDGHGWAWYRDPVSLATFGELIGLLSFGGTLLGMAGYFGGATISPIPEAIITLPFLALLLAGVWRLWPARGRLMLVVLPLAVPIAAMFAVSVVKPMLYPRWFSFLGPFFAVLVAQGIFTVAEAVRFRRDRVIALLVTGMLALQFPVLSQYYLNPAARPYDWRGAASAVRKYAHPGDFIVYVSIASQIAFSYYLHDHYQSLTLNPVESMPRDDAHPIFAGEQARHLASRYPRVWVVATAPFTPAMQRRLHDALGPQYWSMGHLDFGYVWVTLLQRKSVPTRQ